MAQYTHSEQAQPEGEIHFCLSNGDYKTCTEEELIDYIESTGKNVSREWWYNDSPSGNSDPAYDKFQDVYKSPDELLDESWNEITEEFYNYKWGKK